MPQAGEPGLVIGQVLRQFLQAVINAGQVAAGVLSQLQLIGQSALEGQDMLEAAERQRQGEAPVAADCHRVQPGDVLAGVQERGSGCGLLGVLPAQDSHAREAVLWMGVLGQRLHVVSQPDHVGLRLFDLLREVTQHIVLHAVLLALVAGLQETQSGDVHVQLHALLDTGVAGAQGLDFSEGQCGLVHVLAGAHRGPAGHNLGNELLLVLHGLPEVGVERGLCDVAEHVDFLIHVPPALNAALALNQVPGTPRALQVMRGDKPLLDIGPGPHLLGAADEDPHLA